MDGSCQGYTVERDTVHEPPFAGIIVHGPMPGRPIVPDGDRMLRPFEAADVVFKTGMLVQLREQIVGLVLRPAFDRHGDEWSGSERVGRIRLDSRDRILDLTPFLGLIQFVVFQ